ncbi:MAG: phosphoserine phosphatase [Methanocellales archaeon]|nr:phosphoserine phosphatase [Methanocellales archaeon]
MLEELLKRKAKVEKEAEKAKEGRNEWNAKASELAAQRDEFNARMKNLVKEAQAFKEVRDEYNQKVSQYKAKRDELNEEAGKIYVKVDRLRKRKSAGGGSLHELRREIDLLEFKQQTEVLSIDKERQLVERISTLQEEFLKKKAQLEQDKELKALLGEAQTLRDKASKYHEKVTKYADLAQEQHDKMIATFNEVDAVRAEADEMHKEFVKAQETADEHHHRFIKLQKEVRDFNKLIAGLKRMSREAKESEERAKAKEKAENIYDRLKKGGKIDTEDLLLLQRSGLL